MQKKGLGTNQDARPSTSPGVRLVLICSVALTDPRAVGSDEGWDLEGGAGMMIIHSRRNHVTVVYGVEGTVCDGPDVIL